MNKEIDSVDTERTFKEWAKRFPQRYIDHQISLSRVASTRVRRGAEHLAKGDRIKAASR